MFVLFFTFVHFIKHILDERKTLKNILCQLQYFQLLEAADRRCHLSKYEGGGKEEEEGDIFVSAPFICCIPQNIRLFSKQELFIKYTSFCDFISNTNHSSSNDF